MQRKKAISIWLTMLFFVVAVPAHSGTLDGKTFAGKNGQIGKNDSDFTADIYSDKYGRITYTGSVKGNDLEATFVWFDKGKYERPEQVKWWKGSIKK
jgi:hypothetical protein